MTRFARAKGSKASNEKTPEDSTPWEVMKEQLLQAQKNNEDARKREEAEKQRIENYENFLKERKVQKRKATWCEFPGVENKNNNNANDISEKPIIDKNKQKPKKKKNKTQLNTSNEASEPNSTDEIEVNEESKGIQKKKKNKNTENKNEKPDDIKVSCNTETKPCNSPVKKSKKKKSKSQQEKKNVMSINESNGKVSETANSSKQNNNDIPKKVKNKKFIDGNPVRRKPVDDHSFQLIINGKEVKLVRFDGFPIMQKDAERLTELRTSMVKKGIPKSEIKRTMKLERRRAEKALARLRREVCYNCRKGGHNLSDCPDLKSIIPGADVAEGVCFKCGSTEHRQFECKVQRDKEFRFATCFICKEQGHIARQCPDNPKGLYPNGGSCRLCGDITHLRKDCPTVQDQRIEKLIKLQTIDKADNLEDIDNQPSNSVQQEITKKPKKIKF